jgi:sodium-dependent dicarboxylate transporter 2/3/5
MDELHYVPEGRPRLVLRRGWKPLIVALVAAGVTGLFVHSHSLPAEVADGQLSGAGLRVLAVFAGALLLWVTEAVPLVTTGLAVFVGLVLAAIDPAVPKPLWNVQQVSNWFGDRVVFFLLGIFLVAGSLSASHVVDHGALRLLNILGTSPRRLRQGVYWTAFFASWLMAEHAVAAMLFPVIARIRDALGRPRQSSTYVAGLFLGLAWGCTIGGIVTYLGGARIALAMGIAQAKGVDTPSFFGLMAHSLPIAIPLGIAAAVILEIAFPVDVKDVSVAREALATRRRELGRFGPRQILVTTVLVATIAAWAFTGVKYLAPVALGSAALLIGSGLVRWREVQAHVPWDLLIMEAGALALCAALEQSGAAAWGAHQAFTQLGGLTPWLVIAAVALATVILTELFSNPAVVTLLVPLLIASSAALGVTAIDLTLVVALACGLSFVLPLGSPPLAIAFASGEYTVRKAAGWGLLLDLLAVPVVVLVWWLCW